MRASLTVEQQALVEVVRELAAGGRDAARVVVEGGDAPARATEVLASTLAGLGVPEDAGGAGGGLTDLALVLFELGRQVVPSSFAVRVLAEQVALAAGLYPALDGYDGRVALAVTEEDVDEWGPWRTQIADGTVAGDKIGVPGGGDAAVVVLVGGDDDVALAVPAHRQTRASLDRTRPAADLAFSGQVVASARSGACAGVLRATALLAAELCGVGRGAVDLAAGYARQREQFDQPVGRFQAVAHPLADAHVQLELAWSLTLYACWALDADHPRAIQAVHAAKCHAGAAAVVAAERGLQVHGGMGMTWEADPHLYLRRALVSDQWLGGHGWHAFQVGADVLARA